MAVSAVIDNGKIVTSATQESLQKSNSSTANKDDFLQLLVAQMKYQDPMEPTQNTEWVSQYAQFSQVEELQNMAQNMTLSRASGLVGQTVLMNVEGADGKVSEIQGRVDFVSYEGGKAFLSIDGELYSMDDLKYVVDDRYASAMENANAFVKAFDSLPALSDLTIADLEKVASIAESFDNLTDREKEFLGESKDEYDKKIDEYVTVMAQIVKAANQAAAEASTGTTTAETTDTTPEENVEANSENAAQVVEA